MARATSSFPVPLLPLISTVPSVDATFLIVSNTRCIAGLCPMIWSKVVLPVELAAQELVLQRHPPVCEAAGSIFTSSSSNSTGFRM